MTARVLAVIALCLSVACGGGSSDSTGPAAATGDTLRFSYSSRRGSGTFDAHRSQSGNASYCTVAAAGETYACAFRHGSGDYWIQAAQAVDESISTTIWFVLDAVTAPGTLSAGPSCGASCVGIMSVTVNVNVRLNCCSTDGVMSFSTGSVVITSVAGGRLQGTFSGSYTDPFPNGSGTFTVTNGYFNLRLRGM